MECPACKTENPEGAKFCQNCGAKLILACAECGTELPFNAKFCHECGAQVAEPSVSTVTDGEGSKISEAFQKLIPQKYAERLREAGGQMARERRLVTILFSDVKGSTAMAEELDPEDVMEIMDGAFNVLIEPVVKYEGTLARLMGDAVLAFFGAPISHEDDPERAIRAGLEIVAGAKEYAATLQEERGIEGFNVRVGINTGLVVVGEVGSDLRVEYTAMGNAINLAARMEKNAPEGGVLIAHDTYKLVRGVFDVQQQEPISVKGKAEPVTTYLVERAKPRAFRTPTRGVEGIETRMVGRETELKSLQDALYAAMEDGEGQIITILGEAGVGKSRLLYEFINWIELLPQEVRFYPGRSLRYAQNQPYALLQDVFSNRFLIQDGDALDEVQYKVEAGFGEVFGRDEVGIMRAHIIGYLLGFELSGSPHIKEVIDDAQQLRDRARMYLDEYFQGISDAGQAVIFLEDIHWADESSLVVVNQLARIAAHRSILIVGLARPIIFERQPHWGEGLDNHYRLEIKPLSGVDSHLLLEEILQRVKEVPTELSDLVIKNAEGNPFYIEELIKMLIEDGVIVKEETQWRIELPRFADIDVPPTLTGVLQARLDSLPQGERALLQQASVVGRIFWDRVLQYMVRGDDERIPYNGIGEGLSSLRGRELIFHREGSTILGSHEYIFKHALLRDVTYESVLKRLRRVYHRLVAEWFIEQGDEYPGLIADHLEQAGEVEGAVKYLREAGDQAWNKYASQEAIQYYSKALRLLPVDDPRRFKMLAARAGVYNLTAQRDEQRADIDAMLRLAEVMDKDVYRCDARLMLADYYLITEPFQVREQALYVVEMARSMGDPVREAHALKRMASLAGRHILNFQECISYFERAAEIFEDAGLYPEAADCLVKLSGYTGGDWKHTSGRSGAEQALIWCREEGDLRKEAVALRQVADEHRKQNRDTEAQAFAKEALALHREIGDRTDECQTLLFVGYLVRGKLELAEHYLRQSLAMAEAVGSAKVFMLAADGLWKFWYNPRGEYQECLEFCDAYMVKTNSSGRVWSFGYFNWLKSVILADLGLPEVAREQLKSYFFSPEKREDQISNGYSFLDLGRCEIELGEYTSAQQYLQSAAELGQKTGYSYFTGSSLALQAFAILLEGESASLQGGLDLAIQAVNLFRGESLQDYNGKLWYGEALKTLASYHLLLGNLKEALEASKEVLTLLETPPVLPKPHEVHYIHSRVLTALGRESEADEYLQRAYAWVMHVAAKLTEEKLRKSWLEKVRTNREIINECEKI